MSDCFTILAASLESDGKYSYNPLQMCQNAVTNAIELSTEATMGGDADAVAALTKAATAINTYHFGDVDSLWLLIAGAMVFLMQLGFGMLEAGAVRSKNVSNILFKNIMDAGLGAICWFIIGYGFAYGDDDDGGFIGTANFALTSGDYMSWFFQWAFAATAATIVSGSVAERIRLEAYFIYSVVITIFIYPVVVHWVWDEQGWISSFTDPLVDYPAVDFAGSGVVHMVGGFCGLVGAYCVGPRLGRFTDTDEEKAGAISGHSLPFQVMGTLILWFGWYGFNCGSTLAVKGAISTIAARVAVTTTLGAASGCLTSAMFSYFSEHSYDLSKACNGALAGLVSITAGCSVVSPGSSIAIGALGGIFYALSSQFMTLMKIDDPLDAASVHGCCGFWGVLAVGFFAEATILEEAGYNADIVAMSLEKRVLCQLIEALMVMLWTVATSIILFKGIDMTIGLRVSKETELEGMDMYEHGGAAYNISTTTLFAGASRSTRSTNNAELEMGSQLAAGQRSPGVGDDKL